MMALLKGFPAEPVPSPSPSLCSTRWTLGLFSQAGPNPSQQLVHAAPSAWKPFLPVALLRDLLGILAETGPMPPPWMPLSLCFSPPRPPAPTPSLLQQRGRLCFIHCCLPAKALD